jgi:hypothetical protein
VHVPFAGIEVRQQIRAVAQFGGKHAAWCVGLQARRPDEHRRDFVRTHRGGSRVDDAKADRTLRLESQHQSLAIGDHVLHDRGAVSLLAGGHAVGARAQAREHEAAVLVRTRHDAPVIRARRHGGDLRVRHVGAGRDDEAGEFAARRQLKVQLRRLVGEHRLLWAFLGRVADGLGAERPGTRCEPREDELADAVGDGGAPFATLRQAQQLQARRQCRDHRTGERCCRRGVDHRAAHGHAADQHELPEIGGSPARSHAPLARVAVHDAEGNHLHGRSCAGGRHDEAERAVGAGAGARERAQKRAALLSLEQCERRQQRIFGKVHRDAAERRFLLVDDAPDQLDVAAGVYARDIRGRRRRRRPR